jgi:hypothetical protein
VIIVGAGFVAAAAFWALVSKLRARRALALSAP